MSSNNQIPQGTIVICGAIGKPKVMLLHVSSKSREIWLAEKRRERQGEKERNYAHILP